MSCHHLVLSLLCRLVLSSCCRLVLSSSFHCLTLLLPHHAGAGWLLCCLSSRHHLVLLWGRTLVLLSSSYCDTLSSSHRFNDNRMGNSAGPALMASAVAYWRTITQEPWIPPDTSMWLWMAMLISLSLYMPPSTFWKLWIGRASTSSCHMGNAVMGLSLTASWVGAGQSVSCHEKSLPLVYRINRTNIPAVTRSTAEYTPLN